MMHRLALAAATAVLLVAGCGGTDDADGTSDAPAAERAAAASPTGQAPDGIARVSPLPLVAASPQPTAAGQRSPAAAARTQAPLTAATTETAPAEASTAAGTYTYDVSGTVNAGTPQPVDGEATLTVDRPAGGRQSSVLEGRQGRTEQDIVTRSDGRYLARLSLTNPAFTKEFVPSSPVLLVPTPQTVDRSWSWRTTSTDGKTTAALTARIVRTETLTIGGQRTPTSVIESTLRLTGDITYTGRTTTWYDPAHRLPVKDHSRGNGTVSGFAFTTDLTSVLRSTEPA